LNSPRRHHLADTHLRLSPVALTRSGGIGQINDLRRALTGARRYYQPCFPWPQSKTETKTSVADPPGIAGDWPGTRGTTPGQIRHRGKSHGRHHGRFGSNRRYRPQNRHGHPRCPDLISYSRCSPKSEKRKTKNDNKPKISTNNQITYQKLNA